jgi:hypothetical protein
LSFDVWTSCNVTKIVVDGALRKQLGSLLETIEFTDVSGRVLGRFLPAAALAPKVSNEEIEQRLKKGGGRPLADIMSDLERRK